MGTAISRTLVPDRCPSSLPLMAMLLASETDWLMALARHQVVLRQHLPLPLLVVLPNVPLWTAQLSRAPMVLSIAFHVVVTVRVISSPSSLPMEKALTDVSLLAIAPPDVQASLTRVTEL